jgi:hypothetical protein
MYLKWIAAQFDPQPDKTEIHIPFGFKRGFYQAFLEYWIDECEGGINEEVGINCPFSAYRSPTHPAGD